MRTSGFLLTISFFIIWSIKGYSQCDFTISNSTPCANTLVNFNVVVPTGSYTWDFDGDGTIDGSGSNYNFSYPQAGVDVGYVVTLYENGVACNSDVVVVQATPDPAIGVIPGSGIMEGNQIRNCSGIPNATLEIYNASTTIPINDTYLINWGDGSIEIFNNSTFTPTSAISHTFPGFGYYDIVLMVTSTGGCVNVGTFTYYNGGNPSVGLANPGNTVGLCAPATIDFPITNTENNSTGTVYEIYVGGELVGTYTQENVPDVFSYTFEESSCGVTSSSGDYENAYDVQVVATNPCGSSAAIIAPIELSTPPDVVFVMDEPSINCQGETFTLTNASTGISEVVSGSPSTCTSLSPSWTITPGFPGVDWVIVSGNLFDSDQIEIEFLIPGNYTIEMTVNSPSCGSGTYSETIEVLADPDPSADLTLTTNASPGVDDCIPTIASVENQSVGDSLSFLWQISPNTGWIYLDTFSATTEDLQVEFNEEGVYTISLTATNACGSETWDTTINIATVPEVILEPIPAFCNEATLDFDPTNVTFLNNFGTISAITWDFPGGQPSSSTESYPTGIYYDTPGTYTITVTVTNQCGTSSTTGSFDIVQPGAITIDDDITVCPDGTPFTVNASPAGGTWSGDGVDAAGLFTPSTSVIGDNTLTYTYLDAGCPLSDTMVVTVLPYPVVDAGADQTACENDAPFFITGGNPGGGTWTSNNGGVIVGSNVFDPVASGAGVYTLTYTYTDASGCSNSDDKTLIIFALPVVDAGADQSICLNPNDIQLTGYNPAGGIWTGPGVTSGGVFNASNTPGEGSYTLTYTYTNPGTGCTNSDEMIMTVVSNTPADAGPDEVVCLNDSPFSITTGTPTGGTWSGNGVNPSSNIFDPSLAGTGVHVLTYTTGTGVCQTSDTKNITVEALPVLNLPGDQELCVNGPVFNLNTASPSGGTWTGNGVSGTQFDPGVAGTGNHTLTYSYIDPSTGCSNSESMNIEVMPLPALSANDTSYCNTPGLVNLPVATPAGGSWSGSGISGNKFDPVAAGGAGTYIANYFYTDSNGCENDITINITVVEPAEINAGDDQSYCIDEGPVNLNTFASPPGGTWNANGSAGLSGSVFNPGTAGQGSHILTYSIGSGNCQVSDDVVITVTPLPVVSTEPDFDICINETSVALTASPGGGNWTSNNGGVLTGSVFNPNASGQGVYSFTYTYTDLNGCTNTDELLVTVNPLPVLVVNDTSYCNTPGLVDLPVTNPGGGSWSGPGVSSNHFDPIAAGGAGTYQLIYSYTDFNNCSNSTDVTVSVVDPTVVNAGNDFAICVDAEIIDLSQISSPNGGTWNSNGSLGLSGSNFNAAAAGPGTHTLTYSVGTGNCQVTDDIEITVNPLPYVDAGEDFEICVDENAVSFTGFPAGGSWTSNNGGVLVGNIFNPKASGDGVFSFTYTFVDNNGCENSDELIATVLPLPVVNAGPDTTFCTQAINVILDPATPEGGNWSGPGIVDPVNGVFNPDFAGGQGAYDIIYTFTEPSTGCVNMDTLIVNLVEPQDIEAGNNDTLCIDGGILYLNGNYPANGTWSGPGIVDADIGIFDPEVAGGGIHTLTYTYGVGSCLVQDAKSVTVIDLGYVTAGDNETTCQTYEPIVLEGYSPPGGVWSGPGIIDPYYGIFDPGLAQEGIHTITYTYEDPFSGCIANPTKVITVFPMVEPDFDMPDVACRNDLIAFDNLTPDEYDFSWDFGDGGTSNVYEPHHVYDVAGEYTASLTAENEFGCLETVFHDIVITDIPVAFFEPDTTEECEGLELNLTNMSIGHDLTYLWDFGNNQNSAEENPDVVFLGAGLGDTTYVITLTATNLCGTSSYQDIVTIHPNPQAAIGLSPQTDCSPIIMNFANISTGAATDFFWDFGNGNTSTEPFPGSQTYFTDTTVTVYNVSLVSSNVCGSDTAYTEVIVEPANVQSLFGMSTDEGCEPLTIDFYNYATPGAVIDWDFGDGNTSSETEPSHTFTEAGQYVVTQYANSECGYDTSSLVVNVLPAPEVSFTHPTYVCLNQPITFENNSVNVSGNFWDFGNGANSVLVSPTHVYTEPGEYTVTLTGVSIFNQCPAVYTSTVIVNELPETSFEPVTSFGCAPFTLELTNTSTGGEFFEWDFGDGNTSVEENPVHLYEEVGVYEITLTVYDVNGCTDDASIGNVTVYPSPDAAFEYERESLCGLPAEIYFENNSAGANGYSWTFGDDQVSIFNNPTHMYEQAGIYEIVMIASNQYNCYDTAWSEIHIYPEPVADFAVETAEGCSPVEVAFRNESSESNSYLWDFGDGSTSTEASPEHIYTEAGEYDVELIVNVNNACFDTIKVENVITVHQTPFANFEALEVVDQVSDGTYEMINHSVDAQHYRWEFSDGTTTEEENPIHRFFTTGAHQIYLEASTDFGCVDDTLMSFLPDFFGGLFMPNGFSPEQGVGDVRVFKPAGTGLKEFHIQVFSAYGELLWESQELSEGQPAEGWDGTVNGQIQPQDVYVWKAYGIFEDGTTWKGVKDKNGNYKTMGSVILLR